MCVLEKMLLFVVRWVSQAVQKIGDKTILAGQVGVSGHLNIGKNVVANAQTGITKNLESGSHVMGMPAIDYKKFNKSYAVFVKLGDLRKKILEISKKISI